VIAFLVASFMFSVAGLCAYHGYLQHRASQQLAATQLLFLSKLDARDQAAAAERQATADNYSRFLDAQADGERVLEAVDKEWLESADSAVDPDPDLNWENE